MPGTIGHVCPPRELRRTRCRMRRVDECRRTLGISLLSYSRNARNLRSRCYCTCYFSNYVQYFDAYVLLHSAACATKITNLSVESVLLGHNKKSFVE
ncbi:uncharacterized protein DS421_19g651250 [Arachis hypogaea]|uniref:Uncharacterized protein n=1 Tax=Arachis hypogaea TaxID=3818 RepID=A0A6B9V7I0_ARAHY|nr:uncharacterized protein DS421_19g651250 [Arachis hypogaea]